MTDISRRRLIGAMAAASAQATLLGRAVAQTAPNGQAPHFGFEDVVRRARDLAGAPFEAAPPQLPEQLDRLDFDSWRDIRFKPERALFANIPGSFRLHTFHLGFLHKRPVTVNTIRDGIPTPIPYSPALFDYGRNKFDKPLPINVGFAGFRLHYPLNDPHIYDEAISFLGASYFRFLGRGQKYGLSARALCIGCGDNSEIFPFFREFWIETPQAGSNRAVIYALLDSEAATGAFRFELSAGQESTIDVQATLFARRANVKFGLAPLTSMYLTGENDRRMRDGFRGELHDSDGLLVHDESKEWLWRPLGNPPLARMTTFADPNIRGFGLMQRDRDFDSYQDIELAYETRPSYFVEPQTPFGEGAIELLELPTPDETNDNIVVSFVGSAAPEIGKPFSYAYRITSLLDLERLSPNGRAVNTFATTARALGSSEPVTPGAQRFIVDFAEGELSYFVNDPSQVEAVVTTSKGSVIRSSVAANPHIDGLRAMFDVVTKPGETADLRAFLKAGPRTLTETWTYPWTAP
ncbi:MULTISPECIES: glucan biosynthesis protein [Methylosinus]|uniref:Glucan biosynthesis protein G n=1 Tax=Methylosinus trichosporium (strain ATCC 35070 / NCIMB 11131 / UNIQEM 75 / OB3b) TaxID=595536 RepID=A0A2D2CXY4_METT3|nr:MULTISPECIES: glucan biosynthesis protein G [Methylosinus]ATQ67611.1 glucan biosynthesis protein G [Methylosinus trichosporium OB3b]OBS52153.1 glucan biosynthesis protein G [Methylosinus sp. 3S-1]